MLIGKKKENIKRDIKLINTILEQVENVATWREPLLVKIDTGQRLREEQL